ncbi:hypothetical protein J6590_000335 [Homalodisca vitripennis]|nr:hypothetical protein J6590_091508 [Homalodisca vitripennis]KAG8338660.1 hypothetical protein J6590_000335 [Homalodisca vitripennis]
MSQLAFPRIAHLNTILESPVCSQLALSTVKCAHPPSASPSLPSISLSVPQVSAIVSTGFPSDRTPKHLFRKSRMSTIITVYSEDLPPPSASPSSGIATVLTGFPSDRTPKHLLESPVCPQLSLSTVKTAPSISLSVPQVSAIVSTGFPSDHLNTILESPVCPQFVTVYSEDLPPSISLSVPQVSAIVSTGFPSDRTPKHLFRKSRLSTIVTVYSEDLPPSISLSVPQVSAIVSTGFPSDRTPKHHFRKSRLSTIVTVYSEDLPPSISLSVPQVSAIVSTGFPSDRTPKHHFRKSRFHNCLSTVKSPLHQPLRPSVKTCPPPSASPSLRYPQLSQLASPSDRTPKHLFRKSRMSTIITVYSEVRPPLHQPLRPSGAPSPPSASPSLRYPQLSQLASPRIAHLNTILESPVSPQFVTVYSEDLPPSISLSVPQVSATVLTGFPSDRTPKHLFRKSSLSTIVTVYSEVRPPPSASPSLRYPQLSQLASPRIAHLNTFLEVPCIHNCHCLQLSHIPTMLWLPYDL